jgi:hypothetical protein
MDASGKYFTYNVGFTFLWQRAKPVIVGWFAGCTWKNNNKWCTCINYCEIFIVHAEYTSVSAGRIVQLASHMRARGPQFGDQ